MIMISDNPIISKTKIQTKNGLKFFKTYNHILNVDGISIYLHENLDSKQYKLHEKNGFQFVYLYEINEFIILPNNNLDNFITKLEFDNCKNEKELINMIINNM